MHINNIFFMRSSFLSSKSGIASYLTLLVVLGGGLSLILAFSLLVVNEVKDSRALLYSNKAFYTAESGIEDSLLRLQPGFLPPPGSYSIVVDDTSATVSVGALVAGTRIISVDGVDVRQIKRVRAVMGMKTSSVSFHYGAQVGKGGLTMGSNAQLTGNVYSDGRVQGDSLTKSEITGTLKVSGPHLVDSVKIDGNAYANSFDNCQVVGTLSYTSGYGSCTAGTIVSATGDPAYVDLPIPPEQIDEWKADAELGGIQNGYTLDNNTSGSLGPRKIQGDLNLGNSSTLTLNGTVWVTGTVNFGNTDTIKLDTSYGGYSGMLIVDGPVTWGNKLNTFGSGQAGSYLLFVSTAGGTAINLGNNATSSILYAPNGSILIGTNLSLREATAYGLDIANNSSITYESGLIDADFTSGPSSGLQVVEWEEAP